MQKMICDVCGWVYDPAKGAPESNIAPGTAWDKVDESFICPECGAGKDSFSPA